MDDTQQSRSSDANATRKRRSSILKSQRPPRTPFSELEFNVATPTDTGKSRRVSFSRRTGVAEFVTNEATTTWKNFYEEHNKSLESSGNESGANPSRQTVGHLGNRIFEQQFQDCEAIDFNPSMNIDNSLNNFPQQLAFLECSSDGKLTGPQNNFDLSALTDHQSKLFGNDFNPPTLGEMSGRIDVNFSAIHQIGGNETDDLDEIQRDLNRASTNVVCSGPMGTRQSLSEYIEVDLNTTHVTLHNEESDMSITDTVHSPKVQNVSKSSSIEKKVDINKDWVADKENIAINPYAAPKESANFALNEEPDKVLVFDGKRLTIQSEKSKKDNTNYRQTLVPNLSQDVPQRKTIVLNMDDDLPNFVENPQLSRIETSSITGMVEISSAINNDIDLSMTAPICRAEVNSKRRTILDNADISMTQALPSKLVTQGITDQRKSILYGDDAGNISITRALPAQILTNNIVKDDEHVPSNKSDSKRRTIFDSSENISMTQALPSNIMGGVVADKRESVIDGEEHGNISLTRALPAHILTNSLGRSNDLSLNKGDSRRRTILDNSGNISITQAVPSNILSEAVSNKRSILYEDEAGDISITRALPGHIFTSNVSRKNESLTLNKGDSRRITILDNSGNISMTQMLPSNIISETIAGNRKSIIFGDDAGNVSLTRTAPMQSTNNFEIYQYAPIDSERKTIIDDSGNISVTRAVHTNIITMETSDKRKSNLHGDEAGNMSVTQALPVQIIANTSENRKHRTITYDNDTGNISVTKAVPEVLTDEKRKTILYNNEIGNISITQAVPTNIISENRRRTVVFEEDACDISMTQSIPANIYDHKAQAKRQTILYEDGNISVTQAIPNVILAQKCENVVESIYVPLAISSDTIVPENRDGVPCILAENRFDNNLSFTRVSGSNIKESENNMTKEINNFTKSRTVLYDDEVSYKYEDKNVCINRDFPNDIITEDNEFNNITVVHDKSIKSNRTVVCDDVNVSVAQSLLSDIKVGENRKSNRSALDKTPHNYTNNVSIFEGVETKRSNIASVNKKSLICEAGNVSTSQKLPVSILTPEEKLFKSNKTILYEVDSLSISKTGKNYLKHDLHLPRNKNISMKINSTLEESQIYGRPNLPVVQAYHANVTVTDQREHVMKENTVFYLAENMPNAQTVQDIVSSEISKTNTDKTIFPEAIEETVIPLESKNDNPERYDSGKKTAQENNSMSVAYALLSHINSTEMLEEKMEVELKNTGSVSAVQASNENTNVMNSETSFNIRSIREGAKTSNTSVLLNNSSVISESSAENIDYKGGMISVAPALINNFVSADTTEKTSYTSVYHEGQSISVADALLSNIASSETKETLLDKLENYESENQDDIAHKDEPSVETRKSVSFTLPDKETQKDADPGMDSNKSISSIETMADKETQINYEVEDKETKDPIDFEGDQFVVGGNIAVENKSDISVTRALISTFMGPINKEARFENTAVYEGENAALSTSPAKLNLTVSDERCKKISNASYEENYGNSNTVSGQLAIENKSVIPEPRRLSFAPSRLSIVLSREDMLNNISMAQAALQKSRIDFDDSNIAEDTQDTQIDDSIMKKSVRMSNEVVKTLHFEDESFSESSIKSDTKASPLKKTAFGETSYMKESKAKVIPTFLKDVSDGIKELMSDLVKPMTDVLPFEAAGLDRNMKKSVSVCSTQVQANLVTSSQIDMDCELYSNAESCHKISTSKSAQKTVSEPSEKSLKMDTVEVPPRQPAYETVRGHVLVFDHNNPLNNVLIGPMDSETHIYNPGSDSTATLCATESDKSKTTVTTEKSKEYEVERVSLLYNVENRLSHAMEGDACSDQISDIPVKSNISKPSVDQSIDVKQDVTDTEVNTVIAMKDNKELLDANSSLTLVDEPVNIVEVHSETIQSELNNDVDIMVTIQESPVRMIPNIEELESVATEKTDSEMTSNDDEIILEPSKRAKRSYSATKHRQNIINIDVTPKQIIKMQKLSTSPHLIKTMLLSHHASKKTLEKLAVGQDITKMDTDEGKPHTGSVKKPSLKIKNKKPNTNITVQQVITDLNVTAKVDQNRVMLICESDSTEPNTQSDVEDCKSMEIVSSTGSERFMKGVDSSITNDSRGSALQSVSRIDWHPELIHELSSKDMVGECDSGVNVVAKIDMLPFMGTHECEWESSTMDTWSFLLLHSHVRLVARLAHRHDNATRTTVRADTTLHSVTVEQVIKDKMKPIASLCVRFACEAMRYMCSRVERTGAPRAGDVPPLLRRCAAVSRIALRWGRAMQDAKMHLAYKLDNDGYLTLKVANIPLRSVWEVSMRLELVVEDARETPWPRAARVRAVPVLCDPPVPVRDAAVRRALAAVPSDWGHVPRTVWKIFRYLKHKTRDDDMLLGINDET